MAVFLPRKVSQFNLLISTRCPGWTSGHRDYNLSLISMSYQAPLREGGIGIPYFHLFRCLFKHRFARDASEFLFFSVFDVFSSGASRETHRNRSFSLFSMSFQAPLRETSIGIPYFHFFRCLFKRRSTRQASESLFFFVFDVTPIATPRNKHRNPKLSLISMPFPASSHETSIEIPATYPEFKIRRSLCPQ